MTFPRAPLSASPTGTPIPVVATASPGTLIHSAIGGSIAMDEMHLWASNVTGAAATLTLEWGGTNNPGSHLVKAYSLPANGLPVKIATGQCLNGGVTVRAFSGTASAINIIGYANRLQ
jgi:hypothetical protein